jgi:hypothetical protein
LQTVKFASGFLLDIVLHCRERSGTGAWLDAFRKNLDLTPATAVWFLQHVLNGTECSWLDDYLLVSTDALARGVFIQLLLQVVQVVVSVVDDNESMFETFYALQDDELARHCAEGIPHALITKLVKSVVGFVYKIPNHVRTADDVFVLIRELASIPAICKLLISAEFIPLLCTFLLKDGAKLPQLDDIRLAAIVYSCALTYGY